MKARKKKSQITLLDKLRNIFAGDQEILDVFQESINRGFMTERGEQTEKSKSYSSNLGSYCNYLAGIKPERHFFKYGRRQKLVRK